MAASSGAGNTHTRVFIDKQSPAVYAAQVEVAKAVRGAVSSAGFDRRFAELINVLVSQINRCAYCLNLHTTAAVKAGETTQRLAVLPAWRAAPALFSEKERAALTLAESITTLPTRRPRITSIVAREQFSPRTRSPRSAGWPSR